METYLKLPQIKFRDEEKDLWSKEDLSDLINLIQEQIDKIGNKLTTKKIAKILSQVPEEYILEKKQIYEIIKEKVPFLSNRDINSIYLLSKISCNREDSLKFSTEIKASNYFFLKRLKIYKGFKSFGDVIDHLIENSNINLDLLESEYIDKKLTMVNKKNE